MIRVNQMLDPEEKLSVVDELMQVYRSGSEPTRELLLRAAVYSINVDYIKDYIQGFEQQWTE